MKISGLVLAASCGLSLAAGGQQVKDRKASLVDVAERQAVLKSTDDSLLRAAKIGLASCLSLDPVAAPKGRMTIPHHYLNGSSGPINPEEKAATAVYSAFEKRITAGMNQYVATGSHREAGCALAQLDAWAKAGALLDYDRDESSQAWYQVEWTLSSAGVTDSVLVADATLDAGQQKRVTDWLDAAARKDIEQERPKDTANNHHYWRALAATSVGVAAGDDKLFQFGVDTYKEAIGELDANGAFPKEMARHENATHYQGFALQPLVVIAQFAARQGVDLYGYKAHGKTLRDAIVFFGRAVDDPGLIKQYTEDEQKAEFGAGDFSEFAFYAARFGTDGLPASIVRGLQRPVTETRIGGSTTILAGK
jgi:poly(beta-D-mannuronate) lyase